MDNKSKSPKKQGFFSGFIKKKDKSASSSPVISYATSPPTRTSPSVAPTSDPAFEWQNALSIADTILEIGKGVGEVAGPASGPLKAACGIAQTLVKAAKQMRQNGIDLQELIEKLDEQSNLLEKQYRKYNASPFSSENAAESEFYEAFQIYFSDLQAVARELDQLLRRDDSGVRRLIKNAVTIESTKGIINGCVRKLDDFYQRFTTSIVVSNQLKLDEIHAFQILSKLSMAEPKQSHQECLEGTRTAILQEIRNWATDSSSKPMFALVDQAGTGKSTIATTMMTEWEGTMLGARFYFTKPSIITAERLASSLSRGLADRLPQVRRQIIASVQSHPDYINDNISKQLEFLVFTPLRGEKQALAEALDAVRKEREEMQGIESWVGRPRYMMDADDVKGAAKTYLDALKNVRTVGRSDAKMIELEEAYIRYLDAQEKALLETLDRSPILVIDALDECSVDDRKLVLESILKSLSTPPTFKILLTCRPESDLHNRIKERGDVVCRPTHPLLSKEYQADQDIAIYAKHYLTGRLSPFQISQFIERAGGLFIWAATARKFLDVSSVLVPVRFDTLMKSSPKDLNKLYYEVLSAVAEEYEEEEDLVKEIVKAVAVAREPFTPRFMVELLQLSYEPAIIAAIVATLRSVLSGGSEDEPIYALHPTFIEYLHFSLKPSSLDFSLEEANTVFALNCLLRLSKDLKFDICKVVTRKNPTPLNTDIKNLPKLIETSTSQTLRYAAVHGLSHVGLCLSNISVVGELRLLFQRQLLYWIELMCLLGKFLPLMQSVYSLKARMKEIVDDVKGKGSRKDKLVSSEDIEWCDEVISMVQPFQTTIEESALQAYYSALPFVPSDAVIYKHFYQQCQFPIPTVLRGREKSGRKSIILSGHHGAVKCLAFSPDGKRLASGSDDYTLRLWDAETGTTLGGPFKGHDRSINCLAFSPDGKRLASGSDDKTLRLWNTETGAAVGGPLQGHERFVFCLAFSPDGKRLASGSFDYTLRLWDAETGAALGGPLQGHYSYVYCLAFSPDGKRLVSGSRDHNLRLWDAETGAALREPLEGHRRSVNCLAFSPDGKRIASGSEDGTLRLWDAETGTALGGPLEGHRNSVQCLAFSPDGKQIASGSDDKTLRLWNAETGAVLGRPLEGHGGPVYRLAFSPDGKQLVSGSYDYTLGLWDVETGVELGEPLEGHRGSINCLAFSPDGKRIVSGSDDKTLRLWNAETGAVSGAPLEGHGGPVYCLTFSPDGKRLASGSFDKTFILWDVETGAAVGKPLIIDYYVGSLRFHLQNKILLLVINETKVYNMTTNPPFLSLRSPDTLKSSSSKPSEISISCKESWILVQTKDRNFRFQLPFHYSVAHHVTSQGRIAFGGKNGSVMIIDCNPLS